MLERVYKFGRYYTVNYDDCINEYGNANRDYCASEYPDAGPSNPFEAIGAFFGFIFGNIGMIILIVALLIIVATAIKIIRQQQAGVVERLGRYNRTLRPGFNMIIPFFERVAYVVQLEQFKLDVDSKIKTKDNQMASLRVSAMIRVIPEQANDSVYQVEKPKAAMSALIGNEVKALTATMTLQEIFDDRSNIKDSVLTTLTQTIQSYGYTVETVVIDEPVVPEAVAEAYNSVTVAEMKKLAATAEAEALTIRTVAVAKARHEALETFKGSSDPSDVDAMQFIVAMDTNEAVRDAAKSKGTTVVVATGNAGHAQLGMIAGAQ